MSEMNKIKTNVNQKYADIRDEKKEYRFICWTYVKWFVSQCS